MHVHLPKPLHGWRAFAGEVGIIVLGVLIALAAGQVVESWHLRSETEALRASMNDELAEDRARRQVNHAEFRCALMWLSQIDRWAATAPPDQRIPRIPGPILWTMHLSSWEVARSSPALENMDLKQRDTLADLYQRLDRAEPMITSAQDDWRHVRALAYTADQPESRRALRLADAEARMATIQIESNFAPTEKRLDLLGIKPDFAGVRDLRSHCPAARRLVGAN